MSTAELKELEKEPSSAIRNIIQTEMMKLRAELIPYISEKEQNEIENLYGKPSRNAAKSRKVRYDLAD